MLISGLRHELRHAAAAALLELAALDDRALVVRLDVADTRLREKRAKRTEQEARMPVDDVCVRPRDQVAGRRIEALPQGLALAPVAAVAGQDVRVDDDARACVRSDAARLIV